MAELTARFAARAQSEHTAIEQALATGDRKAVVQRAHTLAGNAGMFGQPELGAAALELEEAAENGEDMAPAGSRLLALLAAL